MSGRRRRSLVRRLVTAVLGLLAAVATVVGVASTLALRSSLLDQLDSRLVAASERAGPRPEGGMPGAGAPGAGTSGTEMPDPGSVPPPWGDGSEVRPPALREPGLQDVGTVSLFAPDGADGEHFSGFFDEAGEFQPLDDAQAGALLALADVRASPTALVIPGLGAYRAVVVTVDDGAVVGTAISTAAVETTVTRHVGVVAGVVVVGLVLAGAAGTVLVRRELRGLRAVAATATEVSSLELGRGEVDLAVRVELDPRDVGTEIGEMTEAVNRLLGHVESALAARHASETTVRRFVADASHELRTPLASIRGHAELVRRQPADLPEDVLRSMSRVESETVRMTALVEDMLLLARLDDGRELTREPVDLARIAVDCLADAHAAGPGHHWLLDLGDRAGADDGREPEPFEVLGDDHRLRQVVTNLLANARIHTPPGTTVRVSVAREVGTVELSVADDGPGIPEHVRETLFERFVRADASRSSTGGSSTGLGLAIVAGVVAAHGGEVRAGSGPDGGATFHVTLPAAD